MADARQITAATAAALERELDEQLVALTEDYFDDSAEESDHGNAATEPASSDATSEAPVTATDADTDTLPEDVGYIQLGQVDDAELPTPPPRMNPPSGNSSASGGRPPSDIFEAVDETDKEEAAVAELVNPIAEFEEGPVNILQAGHALMRNKVDLDGAFAGWLLKLGGMSLSVWLRHRSQAAYQPRD